MKPISGVKFAPEISGSQEPEVSVFYADGATTSPTLALSPGERGNAAPSQGVASDWIRDVSHFPLTPWLQPGVSSSETLTNRFNGLSQTSEAVETAEKGSAKAQHRAKAAVSMRGTTGA